MHASIAGRMHAVQMLAAMDHSSPEMGLTGPPADLDGNNAGTKTLVTIPHRPAANPYTVGYHVLVVRENVEGSE